MIPALTSISALILAFIPSSNVPFLQMWDKDHGGAGWGAWFLMGIVMVVFWVTIIALAVWLIRSSGSHLHTTGVPNPMEIARERYARGEISDEEFERIKRGLTQH